MLIITKFLCTIFIFISTLHLSLPYKLYIVLLLLDTFIIIDSTVVAAEINHYRTFIIIHGIVVAAEINLYRTFIITVHLSLPYNYHYRTFIITVHLSLIRLYYACARPCL